MFNCAPIKCIHLISDSRQVLLSLWALAGAELSLNHKKHILNLMEMNDCKHKIRKKQAEFDVVFIFWSKNWFACLFFFLNEIEYKCVICEWLKIQRKQIKIKRENREEYSAIALSVHALLNHSQPFTVLYDFAQFNRARRLSLLSKLKKRTKAKNTKSTDSRTQTHDILAHRDVSIWYVHPCSPHIRYKYRKFMKHIENWLASNPFLDSRERIRAHAPMGAQLWPVCAASTHTHTRLPDWLHTSMIH